VGHELRTPKGVTSRMFKINSKAAYPSGRAQEETEMTETSLDCERETTKKEEKREIAPKREETFSSFVKGESAWKKGKETLDELETVRSRRKNVLQLGKSQARPVH